MRLLQGKLIEVSFYGSCHARMTGRDGVEIKSAKHRALIALLVTAHEGRRSRKFLQEILWSSARHDGGSQSLRRALSDLKKLLGSKFNRLFVVNNIDIAIRQECVEHLTDYTYGKFLEGLDIKEPPFQEWLKRYRDGSTSQPLEFLNSKVTERLLEKLCISVVPFRLVYGKRANKVVGEVIAEDISRELSRSRMLTVISPLSARHVTRQELSVSSLRKQLNADYAVLGSLREVNGELALDVDFINTATGHLTWTRHYEWQQSSEQYYDGSIVTEICRSIGNTIVNETIEAIGSSSIDSVEDQKLLIGGISLLNKQSLSSFLRGKALLEKVLSRNPGSSEIYSWIAKWYVMRVINGWSVRREDDCRMALHYASTGLEMDPESAFALTIEGFVYHALMQRIDIAQNRYTQALKINSNESLAWLLNGAALSLVGDTSEAVRQVEKACRLSPLDPLGYFYNTLRAAAYLSDNRPTEALKLAEHAYSTNPRHATTLRIYLTALDAVGQHGKARLIGQEMMQHQPTYSISSFVRSNPAAPYARGKMMISAMERAGIPA